MTILTVLFCHSVAGGTSSEKDNFCLYEFPGEIWEVNYLPAEEVPPEIPEPALGINFSRAEMHAKFVFGPADRKRLFTMINDLPTIYEVVTGTAKKQTKEKSTVTNQNGNKSKSGSKGRGSEVGKYSKHAKEEAEGLDKEDEEDEEKEETLCCACGERYASDEFWICCDICEIWFHGKCVKITPAKAEHIKQYKCPSCSNKRGRS